MKRAAWIVAVLCVFVAPVLVPAQEPVESGVTEEVQVNLVMVEVLVMDGGRRTVADLTKDDFTLTVQGRETPIDVFDVTCPDGALDDPVAVERGKPRDPIAPGVERKIVLVFDYFHLGNTIQQTDRLREARAAMILDKQPNDSVMIAGLADGVRIEQRFTKDTAALVATLERMEYDASLYGREFGTITPRAFFDNLATVLDLVNTYEGTKAVILFSGGIGTSTDWDTLYWDIAQRAAAARAPIYPATPGGSVAGPPSLARLANESGGRGTWAINDMTLAYARAQRDLACRYALGFYAEPAKRGTRSVRVRLNQKGTNLRFPEMIKQWTEEERRESRLRAAFADPERFDEPLVRVMVVPARARSSSKWEAVAVLHFPLPVEDNSAKVNVAATLSRGHLSLDKFQRKLELDASRANEAGDLPVTVIGSADLRPGSYNFAVALDRPGDSNVYTTSTSFVLPEIPEKDLFVRGPILAKATEHGVLLRGGDKPDDGDAELRRLIGENASLEPLIVHQVGADETLLAFWEACTIDKGTAPVGAMVHQRFMSGGETVYEPDPIPLELVGKKKGARCHGHGEKVPPGTLAPGRYKLMLSIDDARGESIAAGLVPFMVK